MRNIWREKQTAQVANWVALVIFGPFRLPTAGEILGQDSCHCHKLNLIRGRWPHLRSGQVEAAAFLAPKRWLAPEGVKIVVWFPSLLRSFHVLRWHGAWSMPYGETARFFTSLACFGLRLPNIFPRAATGWILFCARAKCCSI